MNGSTNNVSLAVAMGAGMFAAPTNIAVGTTPSGVFVTDLDGDKFADIIVSNNASSNVSVLLGNGMGGAAPAVNTSLGTNRPDSIWVADLDGDAQPDIVTSNGTNSNMSFLRRSSAIQYTVSAYATGTTPSGITVADFNKDGFPDIAVTASGSSQAQVYLSTCK